MERKHALDAHAVADLADRERRAHSGLGLLDDHALERLHALLFAFANQHVHLHRVAHLEIRQRGLAVLLCFDLGQNRIEQIRMMDSWIENLRRRAANAAYY